MPSQNFRTLSPAAPHPSGPVVPAIAAAKEPPEPTPMIRHGHHAPPTLLGRSLRLDNVKGLLIVLVLLYHAELTFRGSPGGSSNVISEWIFDVLRYARMPIFIFISGCLTSSHRGVRHALSTIGVIFLTMHVLWIVWRALWGDFNHDFSIATLTYGHGMFSYVKTGNGTLWYLFYLLVWRASARLFTAIRWPVLAILAGTIAGVIAQNRGGDSYSTVRFFLYTPFFLGGLYCKSFHWKTADRAEKWTPGLALISACLLLLLSLSLACFQQRSFPVHSPLWDYVYFASGTLVSWCAIRLLLAFTTERKTPFARLGAATLPLYLGHYFVIDACKRMLLPIPGIDSFWLVICSAIAALLLFGHPWLLTLIQKWCAWVSGWFVTPRSSGAV